MSTQVLRQIRQAIEQLNPHDVRETAERPLAIRLNASSVHVQAAMETFFAPPTVSPTKRRELARCLIPSSAGSGEGPVDIDLYEEGAPRPTGSFVFYRDDPARTVREILAAKDELGLPLARLFPAFRRPVTDKVIFNISKENAMFALATALPDVMPGISLPWAIPQAASDAAVLTVNQIRMAFLLAAASDRPIGYREQKAEIASIIAGCLGWRALARELVSKIPFGGGIVPKAGIAFGATFVEGLSLERLYRLGYGYSRGERKLAYIDAIARGREVAGEIWDSVRRKRKAPVREFPRKTA